RWAGGASTRLFGRPAFPPMRSAAWRLKMSARCAGIGDKASPPSAPSAPEAWTLRVAAVHASRLQAAQGKAERNILAHQLRAGFDALPALELDGHAMSATAYLGIQPRIGGDADTQQQRRIFPWRAVFMNAAGSRCGFERCRLTD